MLYFSMHILRLSCLAAIVLATACLSGAGQRQPPSSRSDAIRALCQRLEIGPGAAIADVGCGDGPDTMVFASIVGEHGTVFAQEIDAARLKRVVDAAGKRGFHQIVPVLGRTEDPHLPNGAADLIYMNRVFHHFARPRAMLEHFVSDLKPGGRLVIVDQQEGPLTDWAPVDSRESQHHWTSELAVVRLAREAGFLFDDLLDDLWFERPPFVLAFRKPLQTPAEPGDPDPPRPLDAHALIRSLPLAELNGSPVLFFGLDAARPVLPALQNFMPANARFLDVVLEEWAVSREELVPAAQKPGIEILRTEKGDLALPSDIQPGLILFADAYHRLWNPAPLLRRLHQQTPPSGHLVVLDRKGPDAESRRLASHHRRISPRLVEKEMREAGFFLRRTIQAPAPDRFLMVFSPQAPSTNPQ